MLGKIAILRPFAISILAKARVVRSGRASEQQKKRLQESISDDLRKCSDLFPHHASAAAVKIARKIGVELFKQDWHSQTKFDPGRKTFLIEHQTPVRAIRNDCLQCKTVDAVVKVLCEHIKVVWILREEDQRLNNMGFRSERPDPAGAYHQAGIRVLSPIRRVTRAKSK